MTGKVLVKGNCVVRGPSLVVETLSWLFRRYNWQVTFTVRKILLYCFNFPSWAWGSSCWRTLKFFQINCLTNTFL